MIVSVLDFGPQLGDHWVLGTEGIGEILKLETNNAFKENWEAKQVGMIEMMQNL